MNRKTVWRILAVLSLLVAGRVIAAEETRPQAAAPEKKAASYEITAQVLAKLKEAGLVPDLLTKLEALKDQKYAGEAEFLKALEKALGKEPTAQQQALILNAAYYYDAAGRREPFQPPVQETPLPGWTPLPSEPGTTPLEKFDLKQLRVTGIILGGLGEHAMLLAPDGKTYNVTVGTPIGQFEGKVAAITDNAVLVKETRTFEKGEDVKNEVVETRLTLNPLQERAP